MYNKYHSKFPEIGFKKYYTYLRPQMPEIAVEEVTNPKPTSQGASSSATAPAPIPPSALAFAGSLADSDDDNDINETRYLAIYNLNFQLL